MLTKPLKGCSAQSWRSDRQRAGMNKQVAGAQARRDPAPDARQRNAINPLRRSLAGEEAVFGDDTAFPKSLAGTMDQVAVIRMSTHRKMITLP